MNIASVDRPFRHWVIEDAVPRAMLDGIDAEVPSADWPGWCRYSNDVEKKRTCRAPHILGDKTSRLMWFLNSPEWIEQLQGIAGLHGLLPDPTLHGGGLHVLDHGGMLGTHIDYALHPYLNLERRLNAILFLNREWRQDWGGALELFDDTGERCESRIFPAWNRLALWEPSDVSFHGTQQVFGPQPRATVAIYYLSLPRPTAVRKRALFVPNRKTA